MKYAIFQTLNGIPTTRVEPGLDGILDSMPEARLRLTQKAGKAWPGTPQDYAIEPVDDQGNRMEKVDDLESEALGAQAAEMVRKHKDLREVLGIMVASRQLHTTAALEMEEILDRINEKEEVPESMSEVLYQTAANRGNTEFENTTLFEAMPGITAWLASICDRDVKEDAAENREIMEQAEEDRRKMPIYMPFELIKGNGKNWNRKRTICFAGKADDLELMFSYLEQYIGSIKNKEAEDEKDKQPWQQILRFCLDAQENEFPTIQVPLAVWEDCCRKEADLKKVLGAASQFMGTAMDILLIDDLGVAETGLVANMPIIGRANKAHKLAKRIAEHYGACLIAGIVLEDLKELNTTTTEQLSAHTTLRTVHTRIRGDVFDLHLGQRLVASALPLEQYRPKKESIIALE